jgi:hypothetical protein
MNKLWTILSVVGVANFFAVCGFVGWLAATDRLNLDRVRAVKDALSETAADEAARLEADAKAKEAETKLLEVKAKEQKPTMTAQEKLAVRLEATELDMQRFKKLQSDIEAMQTNLRAQSERLIAERSAFEKEKAAFDARCPRPAASGLGANAGSARSERCKWRCAPTALGVAQSRARAKAKSALAGSCVRGRRLA